MKLAPLALTALTALTTLTTVAPKAEAAQVQRMRGSNQAHVQECTKLANEFIEWENKNWKANPVGPQPKRFEHVVPIPSSMVTESGWAGEVGTACGMLRVHWNSDHAVYTQLFYQKDERGVWFKRTVRKPQKEAIAKHISYFAAYTAEVNRYNEEVRRHNNEVDRQRACRVTYFGTVYDICTGTVLWRRPVY